MQFGGGTGRRYSPEAVSSSSPGVAARPQGLVDPTVPARRRPHFPCFEGLRALAALAVIFTHAGSLAGKARAGVLYQPSQMGDIGVSVFFLLSGFLIYRPFVSAGLDGAEPMRLRAFWWRRVLRIVPAYWLVLSFFWAIGSFNLGHAWWRYYLFLQIYDAYTTLGGVVQAWSICTEMTFYLLVPVWALLLRRLWRRRTTLKVELGGVAVLIAFGYVSRVAFSATNHQWAPGVTMRSVSFSWLPNQIDLFAWGMGLAVLHAWASQTGRIDAWNRRLGRAASVWWAAALGAFLVVVYVLGPPGFTTGYTGAYWQERQALYALVAMLLLVPLTFGDQGRGALRAVLRWAPVVWVGTVSYGLYLWHLDWMDRLVDKQGPFGQTVWHGWLHSPQGHANFWLLMGAGIAFGLLSAAVSWYVLEKPLLRLKGVVAPALSESAPWRSTRRR